MIKNDIQFGCRPQKIITQLQIGLETALFSKLELVLFLQTCKHFDIWTSCQARQFCPPI